MRAIWNGMVIAESGKAFEFDGYFYFPLSSVKMKYLNESEEKDESCPFGVKFYDIAVKGKKNAGAAWIYTDAKGPVARVKGHIGFWKGVEFR
jgi:uncharacterized protein (DUF427 family)